VAFKVKEGRGKGSPILTGGDRAAKGPKKILLGNE